jgi:hypothetical protein
VVVAGFAALTSTLAPSSAYAWLGDAQAAHVSAAQD